MRTNTEEAVLSAYIVSIMGAPRQPVRVCSFGTGKIQCDEVLTCYLLFDYAQPRCFRRPRRAVLHSKFEVSRDSNP